MDERRLPELRGLRHRDPGADAERDQRAAGRRRRADGAERPRTARGDIPDDAARATPTARSRATRGTSATARPAPGAEPTHTYAVGRALLPDAHGHGRPGRIGQARRGDPRRPARRARRPYRRRRAARSYTEPSSPENQATSWSVEYGPTEEYGAVTTRQSLPGDSDLHQVSTALPGLQAGRLYHYRVVADNATGSASGEDRVFVAGSSPGFGRLSRRRAGHRGVADYWRLGELSGDTSEERRPRRPARSPGATCSVSRASSGPSGIPLPASTAPAASSRCRGRHWVRTPPSRAGSAGAPAPRSCATRPHGR